MQFCNMQGKILNFALAERVGGKWNKKFVFLLLTYDVEKIGGFDFSMINLYLNQTKNNYEGLHYID